MATHFSILACRIPWTEEPGGLQSMGLQRVRHNRRDLASILLRPRDRIWVSCIVGRRFTLWATRDAPSMDITENVFFELRKILEFCDHSSTTPNPYSVPGSSTMMSILNSWSNIDLYLKRIKLGLAKVTFFFKKIFISLLFILTEPVLSCSMWNPSTY